MQVNILRITLLMLPMAGLASDYPAEFSDFFEQQSSDVVLRLAGDPIGLQLNAQVSYDHFLLPAAQSIPLKKYLNDKGLSESAAQTVIQALNKGVPANPGCTVSLDACTPEVSGKDIKYVFDYDNNNLAIFVGSEWLVQKTGEAISYQPAFRASNALINQARLYGYLDQYSSSSGSLSNLTTLGLPYGYLSFNTQYQTNNGDFHVYKGVYDLEVGGLRAVAGYSERDRVFFNTTDFLNDDAKYDAYALQVGSSRNLVRGGGDNLQSLYLFAPQAGQLEVYQGERLLLTRVISEGRLDISYAELPAGVYNARLVLRVGRKIVLDETRQVVNSQQFSLPVNGWDYVLTAGQFDKVPEQNSLNWLNSPNRFSRQYIQSRLAWRMTEKVLMAGGLTSNQDDNYGQLGFNYAWGDGFEATYIAGLFSSDDRYQLATLRLGPLFLSANRFDTDESNRQYRLSSQLYNEYSFRRFSATYSTSLLSGSGYVTYNRYNSDAPYSQTEMSSASSDNITAGWMRGWLGGQWGIDLTYNRTNSDSRSDSSDDLRIGMRASYTLGDDLTSHMSINSDKSGVSRAESSVTKGVSDGNWSGTGTASLAWDRDAEKPEEAALSGTVNGHTQWFNAGGYGYISSTQDRMISATITGTQFISSEGGGLTHQTGSSFIHVTPKVVGDAKQVGDISLDNIHYNVRQGSRTTYQGGLAGGETLVPLVPYTDTEFVMDAESRNLRIDNNSRREFVYPGTIYTVDAQVTPMISQLFVLNDIDGKPIRQARCVGEACTSVEPLSEDGVFRINYRSGGELRLVSGNLLCVNDPGLGGEGIIETLCLPGLMEDEGRAAFRSTQPRNPKDLLFLGKYDPQAGAPDIINKLGSAGLKVRQVSAGRFKFLYLHYSENFSPLQLALLDAHETYVVLNNTGNEKLLTAR